MDGFKADFIQYLRDNNLLERVDLNKNDANINAQKYDDQLKGFLQDYKVDENELIEASIDIDEILSMDFDDIARKQNELVEHLNSMYGAGYKMCLLFVTDVIRNGSYLFYNDDAKEFIEDAYNVNNIEQGHFFEGVVSRKKQMLPPLIELSERRS